MKYKIGDKVKIIPYFDDSCISDTPCVGRHGVILEIGVWGSRDAHYKYVVKISTGECIDKELFYRESELELINKQLFFDW